MSISSLTLLKNVKNIHERNFPVISKKVGDIPSFEGRIIDMHDGIRPSFLVRRDTDGTEWHREYKDLKYDDTIPIQE